MTDDEAAAEMLATAEATTPALVDRVCSRLDDPVAADTRDQARGFARRAELSHTINRQPGSIAAGAVYAACGLNGEKRTQSEVAAASGVAVTTVREAYLDILDCEGYETATHRRRETADTTRRRESSDATERGLPAVGAIPLDRPPLPVEIALLLVLFVVAILVIGALL